MQAQVCDFDQLLDFSSAHHLLFALDIFVRTSALRDGCAEGFSAKNALRAADILARVSALKERCLPRCAADSLALVSSLARLPYMAFFSPDCAADILALVSSVCFFPFREADIFARVSTETTRPLALADRAARTSGCAIARRTFCLASSVNRDEAPPSRRLMSGHPMDRR